jgi:hypothetical protein
MKASEGLVPRGLIYLLIIAGLSLILVAAVEAIR